MVDLILEPVVRVLSDGGLRAFRAFPARLRDRKGPCVIVGLRSYKCLSGGLGEYLGFREKENGETIELYGKRLELELLFEVYAPFEGAEDAGACVRFAESIGALTEGFPSGLRPLEFICGEAKADEELGCFRCECVLQCSAFLVAEGIGEQGEFLDFVLKGVITSGN